MPIAATCPECRHDLTVPPQYVGKRWRCPDCRTAFVPPAPRPAPRPGWFARLLAALFGSHNRP